MSPEAGIELATVVSSWLGFMPHALKCQKGENCVQCLLKVTVLWPHRVHNEACAAKHVSVSEANSARDTQHDEAVDAPGVHAKKIARIVGSDASVGEALHASFLEGMCVCMCAYQAPWTYMYA